MDNKQDYIYFIKLEIKAQHDITKVLEMLSTSTLEKVVDDILLQPCKSQSKEKKVFFNFF